MINKIFFKSKLIIVLFFASAFISCKTENADNTTAISVDQTNKMTQENKTTPVKYEDKRTEMHRRLEPLIGEWDVEKTNTIVPGYSTEKPLVSKGTLICRREWITKMGDYFIKDETEGKFGEFNYYRLGILGYSTPDDSYEWNTTDGFNPMMMTYKGEKGSGKANQEIIVVGKYTDQGILGKEYIGKSIAQRTVFKIESNDRHVAELYFTPPGEKERLTDTMIYTRRK